MYNNIYEDYLQHHGIKGQRWGIRRYQNPDGTLTEAGKKKRYATDYKTKGVKAAIARRANKKVDAGFQSWKENDAKKNLAIDLGKRATLDKMALEKDPKNKELKEAASKSAKAYEKALKENTTYRKGVVRTEVGKDSSRKYLSEAKKVAKLLESSPRDTSLLKKHKDLMGKYNIERAKARRASEVGAKRSRKIASLKRGKTIAVKTAVTGVGVAAGAAAVNTYLSKTGRRHISKEAVSNAVNVGKNIFKAAGYIY